MTVTHSKCGKPVFGSSNGGHCHDCCESFRGKNAFDWHILRYWRDDSTVRLECQDPEKAITITGKPLAYWQDSSGVWHLGSQDPRFTDTQGGRRMTGLNHRAVEAAMIAILEHEAYVPEDNNAGGVGDHSKAASAINAALPHLESATPENIARLRNTPVGRALMSEAWDVCADEGHSCGWLHEFARENVERRNPYCEDTP